MIFYVIRPMFRPCRLQLILAAFSTYPLDESIAGTRPRILGKNARRVRTQKSPEPRPGPRTLWENRRNFPKGYGIFEIQMECAQRVQTLENAKKIAIIARSLFEEKCPEGTKTSKNNAQRVREKRTHGLSQPQPALDIKIVQHPAPKYL